VLELELTREETRPGLPEGGLLPPGARLDGVGAAVVGQVVAGGERGVGAGQRKAVVEVNAGGEKAIVLQPGELRFGNDVERVVAWRELRQAGQAGVLLRTRARAASSTGGPSSVL